MIIEISLDELQEIINCMEATLAEFGGIDYALLEKLKNLHKVYSL